MIDIFHQYKVMNKEVAIEWLLSLAKGEFAYHIDESPYDILDRTNKLLFTQSQAHRVKANLVLVKRAINNYAKVWDIYFKAIKQRERDGMVDIEDLKSSA